MAQETSNVHQFKIVLKRSKPRIWRRIQVPSSYNFWDLHVAVADAFGWQDYHMHEFELKGVAIGMPNEYDDMIDEVKVDIAAFFRAPKDKARYEYDFGNRWEHDIVLEKILPSAVGKQYPFCVNGRRAGPPEDCGGVGGYKDLLDIISDCNHKQHAEMKEWLEKMKGPDFSPEKFDHKAVVFRDPVAFLQLRRGPSQ